MTALQWIECKRRLVQFGYTVAEANRWMEYPHPQLGYRTDGQSEFEKVAAIIDRLESGAYI